MNATLARMVDAEEFRKESEALRARAFARYDALRAEEEERFRLIRNDPTSAPATGKATKPLPKLKTKIIREPKPAAKKEPRTHHPNVRFYTAFGRTLTLIEWEAATGICWRTIRNRLALKWPLEKALTRPVQGNRWGVANDFAPFQGTGGGSTAQEFTEITFSGEAN